MNYSGDKIVHHRYVELERHIKEALIAPSYDGKFHCQHNEAREVDREAKLSARRASTIDIAWRNAGVSVIYYSSTTQLLCRRNHHTDEYRLFTLSHFNHFFTTSSSLKVDIRSTNHLSIDVFMELYSTNPAKSRPRTRGRRIPTTDVIAYSDVQGRLLSQHLH